MNKKVSIKQALVRARLWKDFMPFLLGMAVLSTGTAVVSTFFPFEENIPQSSAHIIIFAVMILVILLPSLATIFITQNFFKKNGRNGHSSMSIMQLH